jgi:DNA-binding NtrC family response regulator
VIYAQTAEAMSMGRTVLVVDDEIVVRAITARMLKQAGYRVREAASAATALLLLHSSPKPDLILIDVRMPGMNGVDLAMEVGHAWAGLPVVLMSGHVPPDLPSDLRAARFLSKPFDSEALLRVVDLALKRAPAA